mmetsp:Transcript_6361/g.11735  ORF Transcript_6361/g.11735 Transcript_6361/m.11735 type:complete len:522 (-) Transcript_6361:60-1625(-)|eukprot:CAMPEP_0197514988 /NCGR_PEP_ID=MMETSP1318-20131121/256_1 /TAXON_ID=552666 /ORGANISM="Partenskyella glossopodia, Strain RCC365" /LENGTH=521 /DNA_ID=CAMNT_0043063227 /DNA_START=83 /DNA_END=1648 /DNA_ORIENTATION=-
MEIKSKSHTENGAQPAIEKGNGRVPTDPPQPPPSPEIMPEIMVAPKKANSTDTIYQENSLRPSSALRVTPPPPQNKPDSPPTDKKKMMNGGDSSSNSHNNSDSKDSKRTDSNTGLLDPSNYPIERGQEEREVVAKTIKLINKRDPTLLKRYRSDSHKISRVVMREVRPKNGYDAVKAARFYHETVVWREQFNIEHLLRHPPAKLDVYNKLMPELSYGCYDRHGYPVLFMKFGLNTGKQVLNRLSTQEFSLCHAYCLEMMELCCRQQTKKLGYWIDKMRVVIDFQGVSIFAVRDILAFAKRMAHMDTTYYTGLMLSTHLVNVPSTLSWATALFWPFVSAGVKRKVKLFTTGFEKSLLQLISPENLPKQYGGAREWDPEDPNRVDWKTFDLEQKAGARKAMELKSIFLKSQQKHTLNINVKKGTQISYYFETGVTALHFEVVLEKVQDGVKEEIVLVEDQSRKSHLLPEKAFLNIFDDATVIFKWKNDNGWSTKKQTLTYAVKTQNIEVPESDGTLGHSTLIV